MIELELESIDLESKNEYILVNLGPLSNNNNNIIKIKKEPCKRMFYESFIYQKYLSLGNEENNTIFIQDEETVPFSVLTFISHLCEHNEWPSKATAFRVYEDIGFDSSIKDNTSKCASYLNIPIFELFQTDTWQSFCKLMTEFKPYTVLCMHQRPDIRLLEYLFFPDKCPLLRDKIVSIASSFVWFKSSLISFIQRLLSQNALYKHCYIILWRLKGLHISDSFINLLTCDMTQGDNLKKFWDLIPDQENQKFTEELTNQRVIPNFDKPRKQNVHATPWCLRVLYYIIYPKLKNKCVIHLMQPGTEAQYNETLYGQTIFQQRVANVSVVQIIDHLYNCVFNRLTCVDESFPSILLYGIRLINEFKNEENKILKDAIKIQRACVQSKNVVALKLQNQEHASKIMYRISTKIGYTILTNGIDQNYLYLTVLSILQYYPDTILNTALLCQIAKSLPRNLCSWICNIETQSKIVYTQESLEKSPQWRSIRKIAKMILSDETLEKCLLNDISGVDLLEQCLENGLEAPLIHIRIAYILDDESLIEKFLFDRSVCKSIFSDKWMCDTFCSRLMLANKRKENLEMEGERHHQENKEQLKSKNNISYLNFSYVYKKVLSYCSFKNVQKQLGITLGDIYSRISNMESKLKCKMFSDIYYWDDANGRKDFLLVPLLLASKSTEETFECINGSKICSLIKKYILSHSQGYLVWQHPYCKYLLHSIILSETQKNLNELAKSWNLLSRFKEIGIPIEIDIDSLRSYLSLLCKNPLSHNIHVKYIDEIINAVEDMDINQESHHMIPILSFMFSEDLFDILENNTNVSKNSMSTLYMLLMHMFPKQSNNVEVHPKVWKHVISGGWTSTLNVHMHVINKFMRSVQKWLTSQNVKIVETILDELFLDLFQENIDIIANGNMLSSRFVCTSINYILQNIVCEAKCSSMF